tara:strand:- start:2549 stop:2806 length:258 start_codon:yes stop_codon:yes gene_type:complete
MIYQTVNVTMKEIDPETQKEVYVFREIDISNLYVHNGETSHIASDPEVQCKLLKQWIKERANPQHEKTLTLVSWFIVNRCEKGVA